MNENDKHKIKTNNNEYDLEWKLCGLILFYPDCDGDDGGGCWSNDTDDSFFDDGDCNNNVDSLKHSNQLQEFFEI